MRHVLLRHAHFYYLICRAQYTIVLHIFLNITLIFLLLAKSFLVSTSSYFNSSTSSSNISTYISFLFFFTPFFLIFLSLSFIFMPFAFSILTFSFCVSFYLRPSLLQLYYLQMHEIYHCCEIIYLCLFRHLHYFFWKCAISANFNGFNYSSSFALIAFSFPSLFYFPLHLYHLIHLYFLVCSSLHYYFLVDTISLLLSFLQNSPIYRPLLFSSFEFAY